jgi:hypothetical protein
MPVTTATTRVLQYLEALRWDGKPRVKTWLMRVRNGKITEHWGVANLFSLCSSSAPGRPSKAELIRACTHKIGIVR